MEVIILKWGWVALREGEGGRRGRGRGVREGKGQRVGGKKARVEGGVLE